MAPLGLISLLMLTLAVLGRAGRQCRGVLVPPPTVGLGRKGWAQLLLHQSSDGPRSLGSLIPGSQPSVLTTSPHSLSWQDSEPRSPDSLSLSAPHSSRHRTPRQLSPQPSGRGCQLGTCQTHNLFNWLYHIGARDVKDDSQKDMADPLGYGRRRRWPTPTPCCPPTVSGCCCIMPPHTHKGAASPRSYQDGQTKHCGRG
uniref:Uncharacterized protein n=1 Tax=Pelusios castaneus TaxID=367368 RepID=A0A8C8RWD4_9SAUR